MNTPCLGIDMAKRTFVAALWFDPQRSLKAQFDNHANGFRKLRTWLQAHGVGHLRVALESTSTYAEALVEWLHARGHTVFLLNPERTAHYARACGQRNKTDPADAVTLAAFIAQHEATPWQPAPPEQRPLRSLTRARAQLVDHARQLAVQLQTAEAPGRQHLQALLTAARRELAALGRAIAAHLKAQVPLREQVRRLMTVQGVGLVTAATVLAELPPVTAQSDPRARSAWAGLTPRRWQSGPREWTTRLSRKGNAHLRQALYLPALVAKRYNPLLRAFAERLAAKGKPTGAILGALSHKMLRLLIGLLRANTDFEPNWHLLPKQA
ncbi:MAG: IS110 family transposase [Verrucomicrobiota bacterium]